MKVLGRVLATFFGIGLAPLAPGTAASAVVAVLHVLVLHRLPVPFFAGLIVAIFFAGTAASTGYARELGRPDPGRIVIDEVCGQLIALAFLPAGVLAAGLSFALFRVFDILKPWPIRRLARLPAGWGIMADDVAAGLAAALAARLALLVV